MKQVTSYIPVTDGNLTVWIGTYKEKLGQLGPALGFSETDIAEQQSFAQTIIDSIVKADLKKVELREAIAAKEQFKQDHLQQIRIMATRIKKARDYTDSIGKELGIVSSRPSVDWNNLKPVLNAVSYPGFVSLSFNKQGMASISVYYRLKGRQEWESVGFAKASPFADATSLLEEGKPEAREYRAICFDGQDEVGHFSDIITIVHGG